MCKVFSHVLCVALEPIFWHASAYFLFTHPPPFATRSHAQNANVGRTTPAKLTMKVFATKSGARATLTVVETNDAVTQ